MARYSMPTIPDVYDFDEEPELSAQQQLWFNLRTVLCSTGCPVMADTYAISNGFNWVSSVAEMDAMTTWIPMNRISVVITGTESDGNQVVICDRCGQTGESKAGESKAGQSGYTFGDAYKLSPLFGLKPLAPSVRFMANCTIGYDDTFKVYVYDGENLPSTQVELKEEQASGGYAAGARNQFPSSVVRYARLREFFPSCFEFNEAARATFELQYVGHYAQMLKLVSSDMPTPHEIDGLLTTTNDPMKPTRPREVVFMPISVARFV
jgi:hypothetical protein